MQKKSFFKKCIASLPGHVVLAQLFFTLPELMYFIPATYSEGGLSPTWALYMVFVCATAGCVAGVLFWYLITLPLMNRRH